MRPSLCFIVSSLLFGGLFGCVTPPESNKEPSNSMTTIPGQPQPEVWFPVTTEQAFAEAREQDKAVFLYWGAVWCPPCNELKSNVFVKERFAQLMQDYIPVYLDGDTEQAQVWGDRLQISGYPTVLILDADQNELFRMNASVNLEEFEHLIASLKDRKRQLSTAIERVKAAQMQEADWRVLAFSDWAQLAGKDAEPARKLALLRSAASSIPSAFKREKVLLTTQLLTLAAAEAKDAATQELRSLVKAEGERYLAVVFADAMSIEAARVYITSAAGATARWLYGTPSEESYKRFKQRWLSAAEQIAQSTNVSQDTRLSSVNPTLDFLRFEQKPLDQDPQLRAHVQAAVAKATSEAKHPFERHAVISGAAYLLRQVGDYAGAETLLKAEIKRTDTPWYYYTSLASLEQARGKAEAARVWAAKARESAQGRATKIQWITNDMILNGKDLSPENKPYLIQLAREYHALAMELGDGFVGRNRLRAERVRESLAGLKEDPEFRTIVQAFQTRCERLEGDNRRNCQSHFEALQVR
jgi:protein disulfide-isomerase